MILETKFYKLTCDKCGREHLMEERIEMPEGWKVVSNYVGKWKSVSHYCWECKEKKEI